MGKVSACIDRSEASLDSMADNCHLKKFFIYVSMSYKYVQPIWHAFHSSAPYNDVNQVSRWLRKSNILPVWLYMLYGGEVWWVARIVCENLGGTSVIVVYRADKLLLLSKMQSDLCLFSPMYGYFFPNLGRNIHPWNKAVLNEFRLNVSLKTKYRIINLLVCLHVLYLWHQNQIRSKFYFIILILT